MMDKTNINNEFRVYGISIERFSILYGLFLVAFGIIISVISKSGSLTSYIPSFFGISILIFSLMAVKFQNKKKLFMHLVVVLGFLIFLGGLDVIRTLLGGNIFQNIWADISKFVLLITSLVFNFYCIKSFIHARKNSS